MSTDPPALGASPHGYFSPKKVTRRYVLGLSLLAACALANFAIMHVSLSFQQRQVRISALAAQQSRLFSDVALYTRSLMQAAVANNAPEVSINAIRDKLRDSGALIRSNMDEILKLDDARIGGLVRVQVMTRFYRSEPHNLEQKINRYLERTSELADLSTEHLAVRLNQWVPMDIAVTTGSLIQSSFDDAMAQAYEAADKSVATMELIERTITLVLLLLLLLEGTYLFAPLVSALKKESDQIKAYEEELMAQARRDRLTGLGNRVLFYENLASAIDAARARNGRMALIVLDLDKFKPINDTLGHMAGDMLLQEVGRRSLEAAGPDAQVARLGGDEFAIIPGPNFDLSELDSLLASIARAIEVPLQHGNWEIQPAATLGAAIYPEHGDESERLFAAADAALYTAKKARSRYLVYDDAMRADDDAVRQMSFELKRAMANAEFSVYYQPQMAMHGNACVGFEALLRWHHPTKGLLTAGSFIHVAARLGIIPDVTSLVVAAVARDIRAWLDAGRDPGVIGINMPEEMFATDMAQQMLDRELKKFDVPYERICVEVTEDVFLNRAAEQISERLSGMRALGMRISFDDFGTGYASLTHLKHFPFDELKIDRSFVGDLERDVRSVEIIRALIGLARNLGKTVIAEGIETEQQRALLLAEGCPVGQGFLFARALPFDEATAFTRVLGEEPISHTVEEAAAVSFAPALATGRA